MHGKHMVNTLEENNEGARGTALVSGEFLNNVPNSLRPLMVSNVSLEVKYSEI